MSSKGVVVKRRDPCPLAVGPSGISPFRFLRSSFMTGLPSCGFGDRAFITFRKKGIKVFRSSLHGD